MAADGASVNPTPGTGCSSAPKDAYAERLYAAANTVTACFIRGDSFDHPGFSALLNLCGAVKDYAAAHPASGDFYEEDEPVEKVVEAFEKGEKFITGMSSGTFKCVKHDREGCIECLPTNVRVWIGTGAAGQGPSDVGKTAALQGCPCGGQFRHQSDGSVRCEDCGGYAVVRPGVKPSDYPPAVESTDVTPERPFASGKDGGSAPDGNRPAPGSSLPESGPTPPSEFARRHQRDKALLAAEDDASGALYDRLVDLFDTPFIETWQSAHSWRKPTRDERSVMVGKALAALRDYVPAASASSEVPDNPAGEPAARHKGPQGSVERGGGVTRDSEGDRLSSAAREYRDATLEQHRISHGFGDASRLTALAGRIYEAGLALDAVLAEPQDGLSRLFSRMSGKAVTATVDPAGATE